MKLNFRQGLISFQQAGPAANFLIASSTSGYVDLNVDPTPLIATIAHGSSDYLIKFDATIVNAWGPMTPGVDNHLYLQMDTITGVVSRGITLLDPVTSSEEPIGAVPGQMWFDTTKSVMRVRTNDGAKWLDQPRLLVGKVLNGNTNTIVHKTAGSSVGLNVPSNPGFLMLDSQLRPLRTSTGELLTTDSAVRVKTTVGTSGVLSNPVNNFIPIRASQPIPAMSLVYFSGEDTIGLASSDPSLVIPRTPIGIVEFDLAQNETGVVTQAGEVTYDQWNWGPADIGKPVYCGWAGEVTTTRPQSVQAFRVGYIKNPKTILFYIDSETLIQVTSNAPAIISGAPPITATQGVNGLGEIVTTIAMPAATPLVDGYMTSVQADLLGSFDSRITVTEDDIADLQISKADVLHAHAISNVTGLQTALDDLTAADLLKADKVIGAVAGNFAGLDLTGNLTDSGSKASDFALSTHVHQISEVTNLQNALNLKSDVGHVHAIANVTGLQTELDNRAFVNHTHSIANVSGLQTALDGKAALSHAHTIANVTGLQSALDGKSDLLHVHTLDSLSDVATGGAVSGNVLTFNGSSWAPAASSGGLPAGPSTSLQFNNAGVFGGSSRLTWTDASSRLNLGISSASASIVMPGGSQPTQTGSLTIAASNNDAGNAGDLTLFAGVGFGPGNCGTITLSGQPAQGSGVSGGINLQAGGAQGTGTGAGTIIITSGSSTSSTAGGMNSGTVLIQSGFIGNNVGTAGLVTVAGGDAISANTGTGGTVLIRGGNAGSSVTTGLGGNVDIRAGLGSPTAGVGGFIKFSTGPTSATIERMRIDKDGALSFGGGSALTPTGTGNPGDVLTSNGASPPTWQAAAGGGADRLVVFDTEFTNQYDEWVDNDGSFATDVSVLSLGNGLRVRATEDKGGGAGKYVVISPTLRTKRYLFDNSPLVPAVALYHFDSFTPSGLDFTVPSTIGTGLVFVPSYEIGIAISTAVTQFAGGGSLEMDGGTTGDSYITPTVETSDQWTFEFSTTWPTGAASSSDCTAIRVSGGPDIVFLSGNPSLYSIDFGAVQGTADYVGWTQWAVVLDTALNNLKVFKNGVKFYDGVATGWPTVSFQFGAGLGRGGYNYNYGFPVYIDEIRLSNVLLYTGNYTPSATPFLP